MGVEGAGATSGSEKIAVMEKSDVKESIGVLRGVSELLGLWFFAWELVEKMFVYFSLFYTYDGRVFRHKPLRKNNREM